MRGAARFWECDILVLKPRAGHDVLCIRFVSLEIGVLTLAWMIVKTHLLCPVRSMRQFPTQCLARYHNLSTLSASAPTSTTTSFASHSGIEQRRYKGSDVHISRISNLKSLPIAVPRRATDKEDNDEREETQTSVSRSLL